MVLFGVGHLPSEERGPAVAALQRSLSERLRVTDVIGWADEDQVAALLSRAEAANARSVAAEVRSRMGDRVAAPRISVFSFPADWRSGDNGDGDGPKDRRRLPLSMRRLITRETPPWKRLVDVMGSGLGLLTLWPLFLAIVALVRLSSPGPVIYRQMRIGLGGLPFVMYKFRTMHVGADSSKDKLLDLNERRGPAFKMRWDPRVTPLGRVLRRWSLDELPQLFNVLKGDMSLVGPRPLPVKEARLVRPWHRRRHDAAPGITGLWQVLARDDPDFDRWVRLDIEYVRRRRPALDLMILIRTIPAVLAGRGAC